MSGLAVWNIQTLSGPNEINLLHPPLQIVTPQVAVDCDGFGILMADPLDDLRFRRTSKKRLRDEVMAKGMESGVLKSQFPCGSRKSLGQWLDRLFDKPLSDPILLDLAALWPAEQSPVFVDW
ncbi:MAG: hypothetical protein KDA36_12805 [Planctomycetaceae bacterium]|nr:hypothetical protein [Planctomycetaceae bacterium]